MCQGNVEFIIKFYRPSSEVKIKMKIVMVRLNGKMRHKREKDIELRGINLCISTRSIS